MNLIKSDRQRKGEMPLYQPIMRKLQSTNGKRAWGGVLKFLYSILYKLAGVLYCNEISYEAEIGPGLYIGHPIGITVNRHAKIGKNCNIHKGVTIGQENRGKRKGAPTIGDNVWMGINSTIVGRITIGDDVLIAPNSYVNCDVPSHSIVFGNPCIIKHCDHATRDYINNTI
jgi:hexapeptide transferase family protein